MNSTAHAVTFELPAGDIIDRHVLAEQFEGDWQLVREVADLFVRDCPRRLAELHAAISRGDREGMQFVAHSIRGSVGNFGAAAAYAAAQRLELLARNGDLSETVEACATLEWEIARLVPLLTQLSS